MSKPPNFLPAIISSLKVINNVLLYFFSNNTMFTPCTTLVYDSTTANRTLKLSTTLLSIACGIRLISFLMMSFLVCGLFSQTPLFRYSLAPWNRTEHLNTSGITSHGTDSFRIKPITTGHPFPKISTHLLIF